ncbi:MAG: hypothetical protein AAGH89_09425 [Verrucomicrobiota bacterium]
MKTPYLFFVMVATAILSSCSAVLSPMPLAETTAKDLQEALEGIWVVEEGAIHIAFKEDGRGDIAFIEREEDAFILERGELAAVEWDDRTYLSVRFEEDGEMNETYHMAEFKLDDAGNLIAWSTQVDHFVKAIKEGKLEGTIEKSKYTITVTLSSDSATILEFLDKNPEAVDTRNPVILRKIN